MPEENSDPCAFNVLVVDDDAIQGAFISNVCSRIGYNATYVSSFEAAVNLLTLRSFNCITVDLSLGERDGIELLAVIAKLETIPRVVIISGCDQRILNATVRKANASGLLDTVSLPKPIDLALLREVLTLQSQNRLGTPRPFRRSKINVTADRLWRAIEQHEIYTAFQPKIELSTGRITGCEALARWDSPDLGPIGPDVFIPLAEQHGFIKVITLRSLRSSMEMAIRFLSRDPEFVVAVNLSATLLSDPTITEDVERMLEELEAPAKSLMLEVTESMAMSDVSQAMDILLRLRIKGIGVSMDDFGTGYSSLSALACMPFCELKIDRSFVTSCLTDPDMWKVVASSVLIGHQYHMKVVAEGIEDAETWQALVGIGCDIGQGYAFSPALPLEGFVSWYGDWSQQSHEAHLAREMMSRKNA